MLIPRSVLSKVIEAGMAEGADFCEVYAEESLAFQMELKDSKADYICGRDKGAGLRLIYKNSAGDSEEFYSHTNLLDEKSLISAIRKLAEIQRLQKGGRRAAPKKSRFGEEPPPQPFRREFPEKTGRRLERQKALLLSMDKSLRALDSRLCQCALLFKGLDKSVLVANSEGLLAQDFRPYQLFRALSIAESQGQKEQGHQTLARAGTADFFLEEGLREAALKSARMALRNLGAEQAPAGVFPVIINKGFGGVIFHEACGHGLETTSVAEKFSVFSDKLGKKIAKDCVTAIDDGSLKGNYGFLNCDDEGAPSQKTVLIEKGVLKSYMADRLGAEKTGCKKTGSARRQSYKFSPASRMRNTFIAPGPSSLEEMIKDIDYGIFAEALGGGSVMPATGDYNFSVTSARLIKGGRLDKPIRGASLIGNGLETLSRIEKVGRDLELAPGHCGSVSGWVPVTVGQPPILVSRLTVGGRASPSQAAAFKQPVRQ